MKEIVSVEENCNQISAEDIIKTKKVVVFPMCLAPCLRYTMHGYYSCSGCGKCQISDMKSEIEKRGFKIWLVGTQTMANSLKFFSMHKNKKVALGILCKEEIEEKLEQLKDYDENNAMIKSSYCLIPKICEGEGTKRKTIFVPKIDKDKILNVLDDLIKSKDGTHTWQKFKVNKK